MAVAEARAAWQRTANRCFVQEDAKRAPKLACCPSSTASTKQTDVGAASAADGQDYLIPGFAPLNRNHSYTNLSPDSRWWLQLQPNYGYQRGLENEQLNNLEADLETFRANVSLSSKPTVVQLRNDNDDAFATVNHKPEPSFDSHCKLCESCTEKDPGVKRQELKAVYTKYFHEPLMVKDLEEFYELIEMDHAGSAGSKQSNEPSFESGLAWIGITKSDPWWRIADKDELASFVAQRSHELVENCDLPQPQNKHVKRDPYARVDCCDHNGVFSSLVDGKPRNVDCNIPATHTQDNSTPESVEGNSDSGRNRPISIDNTDDKDMAKIQIPGHDPCKAQLLEALRHSQTRAREAEKAAKQAYEEKEHVVKLFFRQASQLFAYKQWFQLLQLENLYFQIKNNKNQPISSLFPAVLPWIPQKYRKRKNWQKTKNGKRVKREHRRCEICKYALVFALGLSLVGAGMLMGWTVGWMLPAL